MDKIKEVLAAVYNDAKVRSCAKALVIAAVGVVAQKFGLLGFLGL